MLLYFSIGGFCSFRETQDLFLTAYQKSRLKNTRYEDNFYIDKERVMKSAIIFGANASGKTSLILGIEKLKEIIFNGINLPNDFNDRYLNNNSKSIKFEIGILNKNGKIYDYSVEFNRENLLYEKLECNNKNIYEFKDNTLFSKRVSDKINKIFSISSTEIFLKKLKDFQIEEINDFINSFKDIKIKKDNINGQRKDIDENIKNNLENKKEMTLQIMRLLDNSIDDFNFEEIGISNKNILYKIFFRRKGNDYKFYLGNESEGIKKIINIMLELLELYEGKTIIIDELDSSISTLSLIKLFNNFVNVENNINGQLIVTSHNILLFDNDIFEPQQIYIVNKKDDLSSELYSLSEFNIRNDKENLFKDFLKGKYGGLNG